MAQKTKNNIDVQNLQGKLTYKFQDSKIGRTAGFDIVVRRIVVGRNVATTADSVH